jgi:hypothetical protein
MGLWDKLKGKANDAINKVKEPAAPAPQAREEPEEEAQEEKKDYVTSEGMAFNDDEDDSDQYVEKDGKRMFKPDWGEWEPHDWDTYWDRHFALEAAQGESDEAYAAKLKELGLRNKNHWYRVRETFNVHYGKKDEFQQAAYNARGRQGKATLQAAAAATGGKLLEPIEGVDIAVYATVQARMAKVAADGPQAIGKMLAEYHLDDAKWRRVDAAWLDRMRQQDDPMASMALMTEYGKYFALAGQGQYASAAQASADSIGMNGAVGQAPAGQEPCTFDRYVEIMTAQGCWAEQGRDVNAMLKQVFNMTALDWSNLGAYWSMRIGADYKLALDIEKIQAKYKPKYAAGGGADDDLSV